MPVHYIYLIIAVICETFGTACLKGSNEFTKLWSSLGVIIINTFSNSATL